MASVHWQRARDYEDIIYEKAEGIARVTINRPEVRNAFRPQTVMEMLDAFADAREDQHIGVVLLTGAGDKAFCSGGDQKVRGDAGYGATLLARTVGHKKAREIWYLCRQYSAQEALDMGLVNTVVPLARLEEESIAWAKEILAKSPTAIRFLKAAFNADTDGLAGLQELAGDATRLFYMTEEGQEGRDAFLEKRQPDFSKYPRLP